ncbi:hypothetical protein [Saccharibacillus brassicae]|uniref:Uncharacterized protein n=1 Tax=Saccharibacillus brassicae TaxID=2583377 RepID=A0A4Y6URG1_SACBS|nr:hypothetical protein [Saccharibacillus brassicae]QDH20242.1 hypothetical protein FFV09_04835 [Saccharibacillus brassicae]
MSPQPEPARVLILRYAGPRRGVGFEFYPVRDGERAPEIRSVFLHEIDAEFVIALIRTQYPLTDPETGQLAQAFDPCWDNAVPKPVWREILEELNRLAPADPEEKAFVRTFADWLNEALEAGDFITVAGNL